MCDTSRICESIKKCANQFRPLTYTHVYVSWLRREVTHMIHITHSTHFVLWQNLNEDHRDLFGDDQCIAVCCIVLRLCCIVLRFERESCSLVLRFTHDITRSYVWHTIFRLIDTCAFTDFKEIGMVCVLPKIIVTCFHLFSHIDVTRLIHMRDIAHSNSQIWRRTEWYLRCRRSWWRLLRWCTCSTFSLQVCSLADRPRKLWLRSHIHTRTSKHRHTHATHAYGSCDFGLSNVYCTGWRRCIGCLKLQVSFRKRATDCRALSRKMTGRAAAKRWPAARHQGRSKYIRGNKSGSLSGRSSLPFAVNSQDFCPRSCGPTLMARGSVAPRRRAP